MAEYFLVHNVNGVIIDVPEAKDYALAELDDRDGERLREKAPFAQNLYIVRDEIDHLPKGEQPHLTDHVRCDALYDTRTGRWWGIKCVLTERLADEFARASEESDDE